MRGISFLRACLGVCLFWSVTAYGLGLGDIEVKSGLNQPLEAEIGLLSVKPEEVSKISVTLADDIAYLTSGVERVALLNKLVFSVERRGDGTPYIRVSTSDPVREPFIDFIIEANWATGRLLREYTVLLDPPVFAGRGEAPTVAPAVKRQTKSVSEMMEGAPSDQPMTAKRQTKSISEMLEGSPEAAPPQRRTKSISDLLSQGGASAPVSGSVGPGDELGRVSRSETLWSIAERYAAEKGYGVEQVMMGIYDANPQAFFGDNINNLRAGYVLRAPDAETVEKLSRSEASKLAREHYRRWLAARRVAEATSVGDVTTDAGLAERADTGAESPFSGGAADSEARLQLASPEEGGAAGMPGLGGEGGADMAAALAAVEAKESENADLRGKVASLEEQVAVMERLITLKDDALVELQRKLGDDAGDVNVPLGTGMPESQVAEATPEQEPLPVEQPAEAPVVQPQDAADQVAAVVAKERQQEQAPAEESWMDLLMNPSVLGIVVGVVLLVGAVGWIIMRRRNAEEEDFDEGFPPLQQDALNIPSGGALNFGGGGDTLGMGAGGGGAPATGAGFAASAATASSFAAAEASSDMEGGFETLDTDEADIDPIAEADVYLAYRRFQQAEELIKDALGREPERQDLQLKLLEIYYGAGNKEAFEAQSEALYAQLGGEENDVWAKVSEMGQELCPDHPLFAGGAMPGMAGAHDATMDFSDDGGLDLGEQSQDMMSPFGDIGDSEAPGDVSDEFSAMMNEFGGEEAPAAFAGEETGFETNIAGMESDDELPELPEEPHFELPKFDGGAAEKSTDDFADAFAGDMGGGLDFEAGLGSGGKISHGGSGESLEEDFVSSFDNAEESSGGLDFDLDKFGQSDEEADEPRFEAPSEEAVEDDNDFLKAFGGDFGDEASEPAHAEAVEEPDFAVASNDFNALDEGASDADEVFTGIDSEFGGDGEDLFGGSDMVGTKLDLARAYIDMDDRDGARNILEEIMQEGSDNQRQEAQELMERIG